MTAILEGVAGLMNFELIVYLILGVVGGIAIGALPGLTSTIGVALLLPVTYGMEASTGIVMLLGVYCGAIYGGAISAILLKTPGTPASAATVFDGYPLTERGEGGRAITVATVASFFGGIISAVFFVAISPLLADFALSFGASEYFALAFFGLTIIAGISGKSLIKGLSAGLIGLTIAVIGLDPLVGTPRFTFGSFNLQLGFQLIPVMIGLFAVSEMFVQMETLAKKGEVLQKKVKRLPRKDDVLKLIPTSLRCGILGTFIGAVPGAGGGIAAYVGYDLEKRISKNPQEFGNGAIKGIAASEAANNGTTGGALIPLLTLGVPGDSTTAVLLGALTLHGLQAGPMLFQTDSSVINTIFAGFFLSNILMLIAGLLLMPIYVKVLSVPRYIVLPTILVLCTVGSFAVRNNFFDIIVMLIFGFIGYFMNKVKIPLSPIVLGIILGPMAETNFRRAMMVSGGNVSFLFNSPISTVLICVGIASLVYPVIKRLTKKQKENKQV